MLQRKRMPFRRLAVLMLAAVMPVALLSSCGKNKDGDYPGSSKGEVIATYNGGTVTDKEYDKYETFLMVFDQNKAMYSMLNKEGLVKEYAYSKVASQQISVEDKDELEETMKTIEANIKEGLKSEEAKEMKAFMEENDLSVAEAVKFFKLEYAYMQYYYSKLDEFKAQVTEDEIKAEYEKNPSDYNVASVRHILIQTVDQTTQESVRTDEEALERAKEVKAKLEAGGDWNALAKEYSDDPGSKENGGLYEDQMVGGYVTAFKDAVNKQEIGKIGDPVQTEFGYHVIKVESREAASYDKLTDANKDTLKSKIASVKADEFMTAEQDKLNIVVTLPEPTPSPSASESPSASPSAESK